MNKKLSLLIIDDHSIVRHGISLFLKQIDTSIEIYQASDFRAAVKILKNYNIKFIILDIGLPDNLGVSMIEKIKNFNQDIKVLIFSAMPGNLYAIRYMKAGANGYLNKMSDESEIKSALVTFINTGKYISVEITNTIFENLWDEGTENPFEKLSNREFEIARLLIGGHSNMEISNLLNLQKSTISTYKIRIFEKLNVKNVVELFEIYNLYDNKL